jgi:hypothetical protein
VLGHSSPYVVRGRVLSPGGEIRLFRWPLGSYNRGGTGVPNPVAPVPQEGKRERWGSLAARGRFLGRLEP